MSDQNIQKAINQHMKKTPVILTIIFTIITAGIYYPCWFLTRRDQINELHSHEKIGKGVFIFGIMILSISLFLALVSGFLEGMGEGFDTVEFLVIAKGVDGIDKLLSLVVGITLLVQCFKVRRIFRNHFNDHLGRNISFSGLATFFFQIYYLQYKINRNEKIMSAIEFEPISQEYQYTKQEEFVKKNGESPERIGNIMEPKKTTIKKPFSKSSNDIPKAKNNVHQKKIVKKNKVYPKNKTSDNLKNDKNFEIERELYEQAWNEIEEKTYDIGLWAKAFADSNGDEKQTKVLYIKKRVYDLNSKTIDTNIDSDNNIKKEINPSHQSHSFLRTIMPIDKFKEKLSNQPSFFKEILKEFGCTFDPVEDRKNKWVIRKLSSGAAVAFAYSHEELRNKIYETAKEMYEQNVKEKPTTQ